MQDFIGRALSYKETYNAREAVPEKMAEVISAAAVGKLPPGSFIPAAFLLQFTGKEETADLIPNSEYKMPYGDSLKFDKADCSSAMQATFLLFTDKNIGSYTESQWKNLKNNRVEIEDLRPGDLIYYLSSKKKKAGRTVSHVAMYIGDDQIIHETGEGLHVSPLSYWASGRVGAVRVLNDTEYAALLAGNIKGDKVADKNASFGIPDYVDQYGEAAPDYIEDMGVTNKDEPEAERDGGGGGTLGPRGTGSAWGTEILGVTVKWHNVMAFILGLAFVLLGVYLLFKDQITGAMLPPGVGAAVKKIGGGTGD